MRAGSCLCVFARTCTCTFLHVHVHAVLSLKHPFNRLVLTSLVPTAARPTPYNSPHLPLSLLKLIIHRAHEQIFLNNVELITPFDEFTILQHVFVEASMRRETHLRDIFNYFEQLFSNVSDCFQVRFGGAWLYLISHIGYTGP